VVSCRRIHGWLLFFHRLTEDKLPGFSPYY